jgi:hypothetical protein
MNIDETIAPARKAWDEVVERRNYELERGNSYKGVM